MNSHPRRMAVQDEGEQLFFQTQGSELFRDTEAVSFCLEGAFVNYNYGQPNSSQQVLIARGNRTLELHELRQKDTKAVSLYQLASYRLACPFKEIVKVKLPSKDKEGVVLFYQRAKTVLLEFQEESMEFEVVVIHNLEHWPRVKLNEKDEDDPGVPLIEHSGRAHSYCGKLRAVSSHQFSAYGLLIDNNTFVWIELSQAINPNLYQLDVNNQQTDQSKFNSQAYLNAAGSEPQRYVKPIQFKNLLKNNGISSIADIYLATLHLNTPTNYLYVMWYAGLRDQIHGKAHPPTTRFSVLRFDSENNRDTQLTHVYTIDGLSYYVREILFYPEYDLTYVIAGSQIYTIKSELQKYSEVRVNSMAGKVEEVARRTVASFAFAEQITKIVDKSSLEIKMDGNLRAIPLDHDKKLYMDRLLLITEQSQVWIMHLDFDKTNFELRDAIFLQVKIEPNFIIPSGLCHLYCQGKEYLFVSSNFQDSALFEFKQELSEPTTKLQRINDGSAAHHFYNVEDLSYTMTIEDSLTTIAPIVDFLQVGAPNQKHDDLVILSGYQRSYINIVKHSQPMDYKFSMPVANIKSLFQLPDENGTTLYIVAVNEANSRIFKSENGIREVTKEDNLEFSTEITLKVFVLKQGNFIQFLQVCQNVLMIVSIAGKLVNEKKATQDELIQDAQMMVNLLVVLTNKGLQCYHASTLSPFAQSDMVSISHSGVQSFCCFYKGEIAYLAVVNKHNSLNIHAFNDADMKFELCFASPSANARLPFLANNLDKAEDENYKKYGLRSTSDLSCKIDLQKQSKFETQIVEMAHFDLKTKRVLIMITSEGECLIYEQMDHFQSIKTERFRFKLVHHPRLVRSKTLDLARGNRIVSGKDSTQVVILLPDEPILLTDIKGKLILHGLHHPDPVFAFTTFCPMKAANQKKKQQMVVMATADSLHIAQTPVPFELNAQTQRYSSYFSLKSFAQEKRSVRHITTYNFQGAEYIIIASFYDSQSSPNSAGSFSYDLDVYPMLVEGQHWYVQFEQKNVINNPGEALKDSSTVINGLASVNLMCRETNTMKSYLALAYTIINENEIEHTFYKSKVILYTLEQGGKRLKIEFRQDFKRVFSCLTSYRGYLVGVAKSPTCMDLVIAFFTFKSVSKKLEPEPQPNILIKSLSNCITADGNVLFMGDYLNNLVVMRLASEQEVKEEKAEGKILIKKKLYSDQYKDSSVISIHSLRKGNNHNDDYEWTEQEMKTLSCLTFSEEGYIRVYRPREQRLFESVMQVHIGAKIMKSQECLTVRNNKREFVFASQSGQIGYGTMLGEEKYRILDMLNEQISKMLPWRSGFTPLHAHVALPNNDLQRNKEVFSKMQNGILRDHLMDFYFMSKTLQEEVAKRMGVRLETILNALIK